MPGGSSCDGLRGAMAGPPQRRFRTGSKVRPNLIRLSAFDPEEAPSGTSAGPPAPPTFQESWRLLRGHGWPRLLLIVGRPRQSPHPPVSWHARPLRTAHACRRWSPGSTARACLRSTSSPATSCRRAYGSAPAGIAVRDALEASHSAGLPFGEPLTRNAIDDAKWREAVSQPAATWRRAYGLEPPLARDFAVDMLSRALAGELSNLDGRVHCPMSDGAVEKNPAVACRRSIARTGVSGRHDIHREPRRPQTWGRAVPQPTPARELQIY
jgi:hypothetical protein